MGYPRQRAAVVDAPRVARAPARGIPRRSPPCRPRRACHRWALLLIAVCGAGCGGPELRQDTHHFYFTVGQHPCWVEVAARQAAVHQTVNYRAVPPPGDALLAIHARPGVIRWNSRNVGVPMDGAFLDSGGRVLCLFHAPALSRVNHVSPADARSLLLAQTGFIRQAQLSIGSRVRLPLKVWTHARQCWALDAEEQREYWDDIGYRPPAERWGDTDATSQTHSPATNRP